MPAPRARVHELAARLPFGRADQPLPEEDQAGLGRAEGPRDQTNVGPGGGEVQADPHRTRLRLARSAQQGELPLDSDHLLMLGAGDGAEGRHEHQEVGLLLQ